MSLEELEAIIRDIRGKLLKQEYPNEQAISQGIVLRILSVLGWPTHETLVVIPEFNVQGSRVDFALCHPKSKPIIFIEVKQPGKILGADKQLFEYAFHTGVPSAIIIDGKEWHFYLPAGIGSYDERRVYKLNLVEREIQESAYRLDRYINYENSINGKALENAKEDYKNVSKTREAKANIPIAWQKLIEDKDEMLIDVVSERVESLYGFKPSQGQIINFLLSLEPKLHLPPIGTTPGSGASKGKKKIKQQEQSIKYSPKAKIKVTFPDGTSICLNKVADTMVEVIKKIGVEKVKSLNMQMYGYSLISDRKYGQEKYNWSEINSNCYVLTHSNTDKKISQLNEMNESLKMGLRIEKV